MLGGETFKSDPTNLRLSKGYVGKIRGGIIAPIFVAMREQRKEIFASQVMLKGKGENLRHLGFQEMSE